MFKLFKTNYKEQALRNRQKEILKQAKNFKKVAMSEFKQDVKYGLDYCLIKFSTYVSYNFIDDVVDIVMEEFLKDERYSDLKFELTWSGAFNSYKTLKISCK